MKKILEAQQVNFKNRIRYPDIGIEEETVTFICGDSGSGKSSLLKLFNATEVPEEGRVLYRGEPVSDMDTVSLRRSVSLVGQSVYLFDQSIEENFKTYYSYRNLPAPTKQEMGRFLELCCADFSIHSHCRSLSGGERQRVYLAVFLSFSPHVLMLDEPTSALDRNTGWKLLSNIVSFCKEEKMTLVIVSHDMELVEQFAEAKVVLRKEYKDATGG